MDWEEWYRVKRDELTQNIGKITVFKERQKQPEWDTYILEQIRDVLDLMDVIYRNTEKLVKRNNELIKHLEKQDNDITDVLVKVQDWMKKYQPLLDMLGEDYDLLRRVEKDEKENEHD